VLTFALTAAFAPADAQQTEPPKFFTEELASRMLERRAVDAVAPSQDMSAKWREADLGLR
jgi:hypothetical protein